MKTEWLILLGNSAPPLSSYILFSLSTLLTLTTRTLGLVLALLLRYELVVSLLSLTTYTSSPSSPPTVSQCSQIAVINATHGVEIYNSDGTYFNLQSGSKKLFVYHGTLSWVEDGRDDVRSLNLIHDGPEYFCTELVLTSYLLTVTLVSVLPYLTVSFLALLVGFKTTVCSIIRHRPLLLLSGLLSNLSVGRCGRSHVSLSVCVSCLNLLLTNLTILPIICLIITAAPHMFHIYVAVLGSALLLSSLVLMVSLHRFSKVSPNVKTVFKVGDLKTEEKISMLL